jgi:hypothetical protein
MRTCWQFAHNPDRSIALDERLTELLRAEAFAYSSSFARSKLAVQPPSIAITTPVT